MQDIRKVLKIQVTVHDYPKKFYWWWNFYLFLIKSNWFSSMAFLFFGMTTHWYFPGFTIILLLWNHDIAVLLSDSITNCKFSIFGPNALKGVPLGVRKFLPTESLFKMMKNLPLNFFSFSRYLNFCLDFWVMQKSGLIRNITLILKCLTSQPGKQIITMHILHTI